MNNAMPQLRFLRGLLRTAWFALGVGTLVWIFWKNFPPSGSLAAVSRTAQASGFIGGFTPLDRAVPTQEADVWYSDVVDEPVYFQLAAPRLYDAMRVRLRYRQQGQPYLALGARTDLKDWRFDLKPFDLPMLDASGWAARQDGPLRVYERKATTRAAGEILGSDAARVAVLGIDPVRWGLRLPALKKEDPVEAVTSYPGPRLIYVYVQSGDLDVQLGLRGPEDAEATVALTREGKTLLTRTHRGDGAVELALSGAVPGLYRVELSAPETVTLVGLRSRHARVMIVDADGEHLHAPEGAVAFEPEFPVVTWETDLKKAPYDAIVAAYVPPTVDAEGWKTATVEFPLHGLAVSQGQVQMVFSAPAIKAVGGKVRIDEVGVEYVRPPFDPRDLPELFKLKL